MTPPVPVLCPVCSETLHGSGRSYACRNRHNFDLSREGYLSLLHGRGNYQQVGDDRRMVQARVRVHRLPVYGELAAAVAEIHPAGAADAGVLDIGCGDGFFLDCATRAAGGSAWGVGVDISKEALATAARSHPGLLFLRTDASHGRLPFPDSSFGLVMSVFAPRPVDEIRRVLRADGSWVIVTATQDHLRELRQFIALAAIGSGKLDAPSSGSFAAVRSRTLEREVDVAHDDLVSIVEMSPSVHRLRREMGDAWTEKVPGNLRITFSFSITLLERQGSPPLAGAGTPIPPLDAES